MTDPDLLAARDAFAEIADEEGAPHTAHGYRTGRYDEGGAMRQAIRAAKIARLNAAGVLADLADAARSACDARQHPALIEALMDADRLTGPK